MECSDLEAVWIELRTGRVKPLLVCTIYRSPDSGCQIFNSPSILLENANKECKEVLVMGDLNINLLSDCPISRCMQSLRDESS